MGEAATMTAATTIGSREAEAIHVGHRESPLDGAATGCFGWVVRQYFISGICGFATGSRESTKLRSRPPPRSAFDGYTVLVNATRDAQFEIPNACYATHMLIESLMPNCSWYR